MSEPRSGGSTEFVSFPPFSVRPMTMYATNVRTVSVTRGMITLGELK